MVDCTGEQSLQASDLHLEFADPRLCCQLFLLNGSSHLAELLVDRLCACACVTFDLFCPAPGRLGDLATACFRFRAGDPQDAVCDCAGTLDVFRRAGSLGRHGLAGVLDGFLSCGPGLAEDVVGLRPGMGEQRLGFSPDRRRILLRQFSQAVGVGHDAVHPSLTVGHDGGCFFLGLGDESLGDPDQRFGLVFRLDDVGHFRRLPFLSG